MTMYPKVWLNDGKLESIADKRHTSLVYREKIYLLVDLIRIKIFKEEWIKDLECIKKYMKHIRNCCDMGQNDTIGKIELIPAFVLSKIKTNCWNDIHKFLQQFE